MATKTFPGLLMAEFEGEFHLSPAERAALWPRYDADALEAVMRRVPSAVRDRLLAAATRPELPPRIRPIPGVVPGPSSTWQAALPAQLEDFQFDDPALQRLLEQACRPRRGR